MHLERRALEHPVDAPRVEAGASGDKVRVLLVGNGLVHGWGVTSHQFAPTGELARGFRTLTGAACVVEFAGDAAMNVSNATTWLPSAAHGRFDAAVIAIGSNDAACFVSAHDWREHLLDLLGVVRSRLVIDAPILLLGIPDVFAADTVQLLPRIVRPHARLLDRVSETIADSLGHVTFLRPPKLRPFAGSVPDESLYSILTAPIAVSLARLVDLDAPLAMVQDARHKDEFAHPVVRSIVEASRWDEVDYLKAALTRVKDEFGVLDAAITLVDDDHAWMIGTGDGVPSAVPRSLTFTHTVARTGQPLLVPDARKDPRFAELPLAKMLGLTFFLGVPLRAPDGTIVGTLSLLDSQELEVDDADVDRLAQRTTLVWDSLEFVLERAGLGAG